MNNKEEVKKHFEDIAEEYDRWKRKNNYYYTLLKNFYKRHIPVGSAVVEFGYGTGEILASCDPARGLGIDISGKLINIAKRRYPQYEFKIDDVEKFLTNSKFDYVIMSDAIDHLSNMPLALENVQRVLSPGGKLIITSINSLWNPIFGLLEKLKLKMPKGPHCFVPNRFIEFICELKGFKVVSKGALIFIPKKNTPNLRYA